MKLNEKQIKALVKKVFEEMKSHGVLTCKVPEEQVKKRAFEFVNGEYQKEKDLEAEVLKMMDQLEQHNPGSFERYKMFPLLKKRMAKEKGIIL